MAPRREQAVRWSLGLALALALTAWVTRPTVPVRLTLMPDGAHELVVQGPWQNRLSLRVAWHLAPAWQALLSIWLETDMARGNRT